MKTYAGLVEAGLASLVVVLSAASFWYFGPRTGWFITLFAVIWFAVGMVLLSRPPGVPEFKYEKSEFEIVRTDPLPKLPVTQRLRYSLIAAAGAIIAIWVTLEGVFP